MGVEARSIFIFFMIFNGILGASGVIHIIVGIINAVQYKGVVATFIANLIIGVYTIVILILGACSWKKEGVLIGYFALTILLLIGDIIVIVINRYSVIITLVIFGISLGIAFLSFVFSTIYFCLMRKEDGQQLYSNVRNMEYTTMPQYQNV